MLSGFVVVGTSMAATVLLLGFSSLPFLPWILAIATLSGLVGGYLTEDILGRMSILHVSTF